MLEGLVCFSMSAAFAKSAVLVAIFRVFLIFVVRCAIDAIGVAYSVECRGIRSSVESLFDLLGLSFRSPRRSTSGPPVPRWVDDHTNRIQLVVKAN